MEKLKSFIKSVIAKSAVLFRRMLRNIKLRLRKPTKSEVVSFLRKAVVYVLLLFVLFGVAVLTVSGSVRQKEKKLITEAPTETYDCIIVLGALVRGNTPSDMLADRLEVGIDLYKAKIAPKILMSGDSENNNYDEVTVMKKYAIDAGVPESDILVDRYGLSTYDSIWRAKKLFGFERLAIVTQEYHLSRALYISQKFGIESCGIPSDLRPYNGQGWRNIREILARFKDFIFVQTDHKPEYTE